MIGLPDAAQSAFSEQMKDGQESISRIFEQVVSEYFHIAQFANQNHDMALLLHLKRNRKQ